MKLDSRTETYAIGEEVVVRLGRAIVFDGRQGIARRRRFGPGWTIGRILHRDGDGEATRYVLTFRHREAPYLCSVDATAIDGTA